MSQSPVLCEVEEGIATITLNEGDRMNPIDEALIEALAAGLAQVRRDACVRAVILTARGRGFSVGADLVRYRQLVDAPPSDHSLGDYVGGLMARIHPVILDLKSWPVPVVCAVNGVAAGGGFGLALAGDMVIAAESAYFYLPFFPALGAVPDMGSTWVLPRAVGAARALGLALTGYKLPAGKARDWGLIWDCVPDEQLAVEARRLAQGLAEMPAHAIGEARAIFAAAQTQSLAQQLALERTRQMDMVNGESFAEGVRAFSERRKPDFTPRA